MTDFTQVINETFSNAMNASVIKSANDALSYPIYKLLNLEQPVYSLSFIGLEDISVGLVIAAAIILYIWHDYSNLKKRVAKWISVN
jgi:hypothetical protein